MTKKSDDKKIDEALDETFPASDPPSYMPPDKKQPADKKGRGGNG